MQGFHGPPPSASLSPHVWSQANPDTCVRLNASTGQPAALAAMRLTALHYSEANSDSRRLGWVPGCSPGLGTWSSAESPQVTSSPRGLQRTLPHPRAPIPRSEAMLGLRPQALGSPL